MSHLSNNNYNWLIICVVFAYKHHNFVLFMNTLFASTFYERHWLHNKGICPDKAVMTSQCVAGCTLYIVRKSFHQATHITSTPSLLRYHKGAP